jgi:hypothetical protein
MMLFPYAGSSLTMCMTSKGKTSRVFTSLRKMSFGVALASGSANALSTCPSIVKLVKFDNNTDIKFA